MNARLAAASGILFVLSTVLLGCRSSPVNRSAPSDSPLPACPDTPNCERTARSYPVDADRLFGAAQQGLDALGPVELQVQPDTRRASAVYRVALLFKDDVDVAVESAADGSILHVRSASRVGHSDLGVNRRRVDRFFEAVEEALDASAD